MCGINGLIQFNKRFDKHELKSIVHVMNERIVHRGPDSEGLYADENCALGMRRLSVIDLVTGTQPIWNEDRTKLMIFNGEIYNFKELKNELISEGHRFYTETDTETVLHGYESYGVEFFKRLEGMFAFAIYDTVSGECVLARDKVGEKPLYCFNNDDFFIFASELKSILSTGLVKKEINMNALSVYFQLTYIPAPESIIKDVYKLMPGSYIVINNSDIKTGVYWALEKEIDPSRSVNYGECKKNLREALTHSVEQRMVSDVPLGAFLSGGFDSSIVVGLMASLSSKPINTFTVSFKEKQYDESPLAALVAKKHGTDHHVLQLDWDVVLGDIDALLNNIDEPFADSSLIATYAVSKLTRKFVTVALTGDAGDELFAGYNKYLAGYYSEKYKKVPGFIRNGAVKPLVGLLPKSFGLSRKALKVIASAEMEDVERNEYLMSLGFKKEETKRLIKQFSVSGLDFIRDQYDTLVNADSQLKTQFVDFKTVLEGDMLAKVDRASMLASLETRVPMLDSQVIKLAFGMPSEYKIKGKERKIILKDTFKDLLPDELFSAPKHGFGVPVGAWLETIFNEKLMRYASKSFIEEQGIFDYDYINTVLAEHFSRRADRHGELWSFFVFQNWYERIMLA